ncbi:MAG TPA: response regulator [Chthoniobacterales bacterium]|jgi:CheY-like chemotaxis protein|nr:response regulator [Chthoniobacterales bacterium]
MEVTLQRVARRYAGFLLLFCLTVFAFWLFGADLFSLLVQRSKAYTPPQFLTWLSLASSLCAAVAFCIMPFSLFRIVRRRSDVPFGGIVLCVAGFLFLCGLTALFGLLNIWFHGPVVIWSLVLTRVGCALLAVATLLILRALVPRILEIPSRASWLSVHKELLRAEAQTEERDKLLARVSHELRTPLAPLLASLTELDCRIVPFADPEVHDCIQILRQNILKEARLVNQLIDRFEIPGPEPVDLPESDGNLRPRRLLLVEDHPDTLRAFARMLRREGFEVQEACNVSEARAAARTGDLLLSDIALPDGDGCDLMRQLSSLGIQGIAISGFGTAKDREKYKQAGFAESFVKPVDVKQVIGAISRVMAKTNRAA